MRKNMVLATTVLAVLALSSCATKINFTKIEDAIEFDDYRTPRDSKVEFIGFNATQETLPGAVIGFWGYSAETSTKVDLWKQFYNNTELNCLGEDIEDAGMGYDGTSKYFGDYTLADLERYRPKSGARYVSFINVNDYSATYVEDRSSKTLTSTGSTILGAGLGMNLMSSVMTRNKNDSFFDDFTEMGKKLNIVGCVADAVGAGLLIVGLAKPVNTTLNYTADFQICVYDTVDKVIVDKQTVKVGPVSEKVKGSLDKSGKETYDAIFAYFGQKTANELLRKYDVVTKKNYQ